MLSRDVTAYPFGGLGPPPGPPYHTAMDQPAGESGIPPATRFDGQQDTLQLTGPVGAGDEGYMGRDLSDPASEPVMEGQGMFHRLHEGSG
jgi:hypothetical protein